MSNAAIFVGWGRTYPGREPFALKHFDEWVEILTQLKTKGEIEKFETVLLEPHGGELDGFTLVYGVPEKLAMLPLREDIRQLQTRALLDNAYFIVTGAITGDAVKRQFELFEQVVAEYEHALV